jgi:hypothetical protein
MDRSGWHKPALRPVEDRFWDKIQFRSDRCWDWTGNHDKLGYSRMAFAKLGRRAHRVAYELLIGPIPDGLEIDHLCRNRGCVNPWHLEPVTHRENVRRGKLATVTQCTKGHPYDALNTGIYRGRRYCRTCMRHDSHERYLRRIAS